MRRVPKDDFLNRLPSSMLGHGMMQDGNYALFDKAISEMPEGGAVLEIGSFGGLSMNLILYLLFKKKKAFPVFSCDPWIYSGYEDTDTSKSDAIDGWPSVNREAYMEYVLTAFKNAIRLFHPNTLPYSCRMKSADFFLAWGEGKTVTDIFDRTVSPGGPLSFVYVDGDHSYQAASADVENSLQFLLPGGLLLLDDSADGLPYGSAILAKELLKRKDLKLVERNPNYLFRKV
jgi:hypothetical protein